MPKKTQSEHEAFHRALHAVLVAFILRDEEGMTNAKAHFEKHPEKWTRALCCGFYRSFILHADYFGLLADFYEIASDEFSEIFFESSLESEKHEWMNQGHANVLKYDSTNEALSPKDMEMTASGFGYLVLMYKPFFVVEDRDEILRNICANVTQDLLGPWR